MNQFPPSLDSIMAIVNAYGLNILLAVLIIIVGRFIARIVGKAVGKGLDRSGADPALRGFLVSLVRISVLVFAVIAALARVGIQTASFVAVLGAVGFAIGFAMQGSLSNFAAGVMILIFKPFRVGDLIEAAGQVGKVADIGIFVTTVNSLDNQKVIIPNGLVTGGVINNINGNGVRRVDMTAGIGYSDDIPKAKKILEEIVTGHPKVLKDPAPTVAVKELADSSVNFVVRPWCKADDYWTVWFDVTQATKERFDQEGVSIPFPQQDVHLFQASAN